MARVRIKTIEPIPFPSRQARRAAPAEAGYNLFRVPARQITIDLLTDSGTAAMPAPRWPALMSEDENDLEPPDIQERDPAQ